MAMAVNGWHVCIQICMHSIDMQMICADATAGRNFKLLMGCRPCSPPCHSAAGPAWQPTPSKFPSACSAFSTRPNRLKLSRHRAMPVTRLPAKLPAIRSLSHHDCTPMWPNRQSWCFWRLRPP